MALGRVALLLVACGAIASAIVLNRRHDRAIADSVSVYACPMHPEVTGRLAGTCPICGMATEIRPNAGDASAVALPSGESALSTRELMAPRQAVGVPRYSTDIVRGHVFRTEIYAPAWRESSRAVAALLYKDELSSLTPGDRASFLPSAAPDAAVDVSPTVDPPTPWDQSMSLVHFRVNDDIANDTRSFFQPDAPGWVKLASKPRETLVVPSMAILASAEGPYVLVLSEDHRTVYRRSIVIGRALAGFTAVVAGLRSRELIVAINPFFVEAERRLRAEHRTMKGAL